jgi:hypothetical protein
MNFKYFRIKDSKFAFILGNRVVDEKRLEKSIRKVGKVLVPIVGVYYGTIKNSGYQVLDAETGELLNSPSDDYFVVLDGQHRTKTSLNLYKEQQELIKNTEDSDSLALRISDSIPANVYDEEDELDNILETIIDCNTSSKTWTSKDFVHSAHVLRNDDKIITFIDSLTTLKFSLSNISRILFFNHKMLTNQMLADYTNGKVELPENNYRKKLELFRLLINKGFSTEFLRKRYMYEAIIKKHNAQKYDEFVKALSLLDVDTVKKIENLCPLDYDNGKIIEIVNNFTNISKCDDNSSNNIDLSEKRFDENIEFLRSLANAKNKKKTAGKAAGARKKSKKGKRAALEDTNNDNLEYKFHYMLENIE